MRRPVISVLAAVLLLLTSALALSVWNRNKSARSKSADAYASQAEALEKANAVADAQAALLTGDSRFVGIKGNGDIVPGVPDYYPNHTGRAVTFIPNTSDAMENAQHARLQRAAFEYARKYNAFILERALSATAPATQPSSTKRRHDLIPD
jgi:hypothetical protein